MSEPAREIGDQFSSRMPAASLYAIRVEGVLEDDPEWQGMYAQPPCYLGPYALEEAERVRKRLLDAGHRPIEMGLLFGEDDLPGLWMDNKL